jgi:RNA polymerase sigma factor (sigma-70 family)
MTGPREWTETLHDDRPCQSYEEVVTRYTPFAIRCARWWTSDPGTVDDLAQKGLIGVYHRIEDDGGKIPHPVAGLLRKMIEGAALNHARVVRRRRIDGEPDAEAMPASKPSAEQQIAAAQTEGALVALAHALVGRLDPYPRQIVELADLQGMTLKDIGQLVGRSEGTVASDLRRARLELKRLSAQYRDLWNKLRRNG